MFQQNISNASYVESPTGLISIMSLLVSCVDNVARKEITRVFNVTNSTKGETGGVSCKNYISVSDRIDLVPNFVNYISRSHNVEFDNNVKDDVLISLKTEFNFTGAWDFYIDRNLTTISNFYDSTGKNRTGSVEMMHFETKSIISFINNASSFVFNLKFKEPNTRMMIILPYKNSSVYDIINKNPLLISDELKKDEEIYGFETVYFQMPKMNIESSVDITPFLLERGVTRIFNGNCDAFYAMTNMRNLYVTKIKQIYKLTLNETGVEASSKTQADILNRIIPTSIVMDRPFVFYILKKNDVLIRGMFNGQ